MLKIITGILFFIYSLSVTAAETHLVCIGKTTTFLNGFGLIDPEIKSITINFDEQKQSFESELLFPTCHVSQEQINSCKCIFEKTNINCAGLSKNKIEPKNIWKFDFDLNRVSGTLKGSRHFSYTGDIKNHTQNSVFDYMCKVSPIRF
jgi:hypothetical protein